MSRTKKVNSYKNRGGEGTNIHHCINKSSGGTNAEDNLVELKIRTHNAIHELFGNQLPHEVIKTVLDVICKPMLDEIKDKLMEILQDYQGREYKSHTYHGRVPRHGPCKGELL